MSAIVFSSPTCEPCKALKPVFDDLKEEFNNINWASVNFTFKNFSLTICMRPKYKYFENFTLKGLRGKLLIAFIYSFLFIQLQTL